MDGFDLEDLIHMGHKQVTSMFARCRLLQSCAIDSIEGVPATAIASTRVNMPFYQVGSGSKTSLCLDQGR